jgi:hypothetical protein
MSACRCRPSSLQDTSWKGLAALAGTSSQIPITDTGSGKQGWLLPRLSPLLARLLPERRNEVSLHIRIRGLALDPRQRECPGFRPKNGQNRPLASGNHSAQPRRMPLQSMVHSGKLIIRARQARFGAQSPVPGRLPALAGVPFGPTGPDQTHLVLPRRGPFCLQDANPRPSGQALPWSLLIHRMLTVSSPYPLPMHTVSSR